MLQEMLADYPGTLLVVSHDRDFLDRTVTKVLAFEGDGVVEGYIGGYSDYLEAKNKQRYPAKVAAAKPIIDMKTELPAPAPAERMSYKYKHELEQLPKKIDKLETELETLRKLLDDPELYTKNPDAFDNATRRFAAATDDLESAETRWLELEEMQRNAG